MTNLVFGMKHPDFSFNPPASQNISLFPSQVQSCPGKSIKILSNILNNEGCLIAMSGEFKISEFSIKLFPLIYQGFHESYHDFSKNSSSIFHVFPKNIMSFLQNIRFTYKISWFFIKLSCYFIKLLCYVKLLSYQFTEQFHRFTKFAMNLSV